MIYLNFILLYDLVYIWYMLSIQKWPKNLTMTENVWSDFTYFGICVVYKKIWYVNWYTAFFITPLLCSITEATRNDYFGLVYNWYMAWWYRYNDLFFAVYSSDSVATTAKGNDIDVKLINWTSLLPLMVVLAFCLL